MSTPDAERLRAKTVDRASTLYRPIRKSADIVKDFVQPAKAEPPSNRADRRPPIRLSRLFVA